MNFSAIASVAIKVVEDGPTLLSLVEELVKLYKSDTAPTTAQLEELKTDVDNASAVVQASGTATKPAA